MYRHRLLACLVALGLAACGAIPLTSLPSLMRIDPGTTDFAQLAVAVVAPRALQPLPGGIRLEYSSRRGTAPERTGSFPLAPVSFPVDLTDIVSDVGDGDALGIYALTADDVVRVTAIRDELVAASEAGEKVTASIDVTAKAFCLRGDSLPSSLLVTTYIKTSETGRFVPLIRGYDLADQPELAAGLRDLPACPSPARPVVVR